MSQAKLAHHFESVEQQFDTAKLGMWIFLLTEIMFFSVLFVAYTVYRASHADAFQYASQFLDTNLGAANTLLLLLSSFTAAWAVRCAQLGQKRGLMLNLLVTVVCALGFMGIKYHEYSHKYHEGLLWGGARHSIFKADPAQVLPEMKHGHEGGGESVWESHHVETMDPALKKQVGIFFGIYFCLTGLHGIHVLVGIGVMLWLLWRASRDHFGPDNFTAVDLGALYWHLVDLIWIFLFPLLYLIS
ncbi:MAG: cytochrome c oxidase subunit 3 family protein [Planctomycetota bacterium]|nr:MAG: cytochrome c oxidase subunit 3 family protein [Planctomycetota bacterium]